MKNKKLMRIIIAVVVLVVLALLAGGAYLKWGPKGTAGEKIITVMVTAREPEAKTFTIHTQAEFLRGALEETSLVQGDESEFGLFVKTVDGVTADDGAQEWWCFTKGGEDVMTGVDATPIANGEIYEITLKTGY